MLKKPLLIEYYFDPLGVDKRSAFIIIPANKATESDRQMFLLAQPDIESLSGVDAHILDRDFGSIRLRAALLIFKRTEISLFIPHDNTFCDEGKFSEFANLKTMEPPPNRDAYEHIVIIAPCVF